MNSITKNQREELAGLNQNFTLRLLATCPDCIYVYDIDDNEVIYRNRSLFITLGYDEDDVECPSAVIPRQFMHHEDVVNPEILKTRWRRLKPSEVQAVEFRMRDSEGRWRHFRSRLTALVEGEDGTKQILGIITDISVQKWAEKRAAEALRSANAANAAKSHFLAHMSHEIRTPLNGIIGMTDILLQTSLSEEQQDCAAMISRTGDALLTLVNEILDFAKLEQGKLELRVKPFDLARVTEEALALMAPKAAEKDIALSLQYDSALPLLWRGDPDRLRQIITNLVANAVKFTDKGSVTLRVRGRESADKRTWLIHVEVEDTGIGIDSAYQNKVFEKFVQAKSSATQNVNGTGLGLAIAKQLVEAMGGQIDFTSKLGEGSTFWFDVWLAPDASVEDSPCTNDGDDHAATPAGRSELRIPPVSKPTFNAKGPILVVDDNPDNVAVVLRMLSKLKLEGHAVGSGDLAVLAVRDHPLALVLMDCQMPWMNGLDATRALRRTVQGRDLPVIGLTANVFEDNRQACLAAGMDDVLTKPLRFIQLKDCLEKWLPEGSKPHGFHQVAKEAI